MTLVLAAHYWPTNADLIVDVVKLGYLKDADNVLDPTYGRGVWWDKYRPEKLTTHDIALDGTDFRKLPYDVGTFDVVAFDPPYVCAGGRKTTTLPDFQNRYGMTDAPKTPAELQRLINDGLTETVRVTRIGGYIFVKCQDYISSGRLWIGTHHTLTHGLTMNLELIDRLERVQKNPRPQPKNRPNGQPTVQKHARRNLSTLFVFKKGKS